MYGIRNEDGLNNQCSIEPVICLSDTRGTYAKVVSKLFKANPVVGEEARKGFPPTAICGTATSAGSALLKQALPL